jgi:hypothetical protein
MKSEDDLSITELASKTHINIVPSDIKVGKYYPKLDCHRVDTDLPSDSNNLFDQFDNQADPINYTLDEFVKLESLKSKLVVV